MTTDTKQFQKGALVLFLLVSTFLAVTSQVFAAQPEPAIVPDETAVLGSEAAVAINQTVAEGDFIEIAYDPFTTAAELIGIDVEALWEALDNGQSIVDVATANGVDPQTIIDALVAEELAMIDEWVQSGEISAEEAADWSANVATYAADMVNDTLGFVDFGTWDDPLVDVIALLGMDEESFWSAVESGQTIAQLAEANGIDPADIVTMVVAAENAFVDELLAKGDITAEEAAAWKADIETYSTEFVFEGLFLATDMIMGESMYAPITELLGLTEEAIWKALDAGQTVAELAQAQSVAIEAVEEALLAAENSFIDELLASGDITAEEADLWRSELPEYIDFLINSSWDDFSEGAVEVIEIND